MAEMNLRLRQAIAAARAGKAPQAKLLAESALEEDPEDVNALLLLSALAETEEKQAGYLERILVKDPEHAIATKRLAQLRDVSPKAPAAPGDAAEAVAPAPADEPGATPLDAREPESAPVEEMIDSTVEEAGVEAAERSRETPVEDAEVATAAAEIGTVATESPEPEFEEVSQPLFEEIEAEAEPFHEPVEMPVTDEVLESPVEESPVVEAESVEEPAFEEVETPLPSEFVEPAAPELPAFEREQLPEVFARKVDALLPEEMAEQMAEALETPTVEESEESLPENSEPWPFDDVTQPQFEAAAEETSEPYFDEPPAFPDLEEPDFPVDEPASPLLDEALDLPDQPAQEQILSELHEFPVEDLRKPAALAEDAGPTDVDSETPVLADSDLYEPAPIDHDELDAEETAPPDEQSAERPFLAVTAPLSHDVIESPPDAREGLAAQLDEELFDEEAGTGFEDLGEGDSQELGPAFAATVAGLESQQDDEIGNEDVFASLVEDTAGPASEEGDLISGFEPADSDIPEWLREAEDSSLAAVDDEARDTPEEPAELNDIPSWLLDDADEEWLGAAPQTEVAPAISSEEPFDAESSPDVATETLVAAPATMADYTDDDIDAAMATIVDDEVEDDAYAASSDVDESVEAQSVGTVDAAEDEKSSGPVSTRALEIFLIVLVVIAVVVLAALALVVFNPFS